MTIFVFTLLVLAVLVGTGSFRYLGRYYPTALYISFMSLVYALICTDYRLWEFPIWWIFTEQASSLFQGVLLFPSTTVIFLRYLPITWWRRALYGLGFVGFYAGMEYIMLRRGEIRYQHGWGFGWSVSIDVLMFLMMWLHEHSRKLVWFSTLLIVAFFVMWFDVPLFA